MTSELLSGPDLGGGYLHQLSVDRDRSPAVFTFHAQVGAEDAGGPPKGSLAPLHYVHPELSCQFGGPRCFHRTFDLQESETARVRNAYNRSRFVLAAMLEQEYGGAEIPLESALEELLGRIASNLDASRIPWYFGGSTSAWLQGASLRPRDIDLFTTGEGVTRIGDLIVEYVIEPVAPTYWERKLRMLAGRAFVGTLKSGVRVDWASALGAGDETVTSREWEVGIERVPQRRVVWKNHTVGVSRLEFALVRSAEKGRRERVEAILPVLRELGVNVDLLATLLDQSSLDARERAAIRERLVNPSSAE